MARIRSVHPSLFTDEAWVSCSPLARILFIGLWTDADDQGLFEWKPLQIKMRLLPGDMAEAGALLDELASVNLIQRYETGGSRYGAIRNFRKFQRPQKPNALYPLPENIADYVGLSVTDTGAVSDHSATAPVIAPQMEDGGWREGDKITEANASVEVAPPEPKARKARIGSRFAPADFSPSPYHYEQADAGGLTSGDFERALSRFRNHEFPRPYTDWGRCFANWIDRETPSKAQKNDRSSAKLDHLDGIRRAMEAACQPDVHDGRDRWEPGDGGGMRALPSAA